MSVSLYLNCFGTPELTTPAGEVVEVSTRKSLAVLAFLCRAQERRVPREQIADTLWSGPSREKSIQSLRQSLRHLRKVEAATGITFLDAGKTDIGLVEGRVICDVSRISQLLTIAGADSFTKAAALWRGQFFNGYDALDPVFSDWLTVERQRLISDFMARALKKVESLSPKEDTEEIETGCRFLLKLDSANEHVHRLLMSTFLLTGRRAEAEQQLNQCKVELKAHLDADPEDETLELFESLGGENFTFAAANSLVAMARVGGLIVDDVQTIKFPELNIVSFTPSDAIESRAQLILDEIRTSLGASRNFDLYESSYRSQVNQSEVTFVDGGELGSYLLRFRYEDSNSSVYVQLENQNTGQIQFNEIIELHNFRNENVIRQSAHQTVNRIRTHITGHLRKAGGQTPFAKWCQVEGLMWEFSPTADAKAARILDELAEKYPNFSVVYSSRASIALKQILNYANFDSQSIDAEEALNQAERAVSLDPWQVINRRVYGWALLHKGYISDSKMSFQEAARINPYDPMNLMSAAEALAYMGDVAEARRLADRAQALFPVIPRIFYEYIGTIYFSSGDFVDAVKYLERGPVDSISSLATRVVAQISAGYQKDADATLQLLKNRVSKNNNSDAGQWSGGLNNWIQQINMYQDEGTRKNFRNGVKYLLSQLNLG